MIDGNIKRFCQLVAQINQINSELDEERSNFYDGGRSFEDCNEYKIKELNELQKEFKDLVKHFNNF